MYTYSSNSKKEEEENNDKESYGIEFGRMEQCVLTVWVCNNCINTSINC
jgi:hypothetical protein